jgi:hypothetical protein
MDWTARNTPSFGAPRSENLDSIADSEFFGRFRSSPVVDLRKRPAYQVSARQANTGVSGAANQCCSCGIGRRMYRTST